MITIVNEGGKITQTDHMATVTGVQTRSRTQTDSQTESQEQTQTASQLESQTQSQTESQAQTLSEQRSQTNKKNTKHVRFDENSLEQKDRDATVDTAQNTEQKHVNRTDRKDRIRYSLPKEQKNKLGKAKHKDIETVSDDSAPEYTTSTQANVTVYNEQAYTVDKEIKSTPDATLCMFLMQNHIEMTTPMDSFDGDDGISWKLMPIKLKWVKTRKSREVQLEMVTVGYVKRDEML
jgi:hypothetical protein